VGVVIAFVTVIVFGALVRLFQLGLVRRQKGPRLVRPVRERRPPGSPRCGRTMSHFLLRLVFAEEDCRYCEATRQAEGEAERSAAVAAAEERLRETQR